MVRLFMNQYQSIGIPSLCSCLESLTGGNHFRLCQQAGTQYSGLRRCSFSAQNYPATVTDVPGLLAPGGQGISASVLHQSCTRQNCKN